MMDSPGFDTPASGYAALRRGMNPKTMIPKQKPEAKKREAEASLFFLLARSEASQNV